MSVEWYSNSIFTKVSHTGLFLGVITISTLIDYSIKSLLSITIINNNVLIYYTHIYIYCHIGTVTFLIDLFLLLWIVNTTL